MFAVVGVQQCQLARPCLCPLTSVRKPTRLYFRDFPCQSTASFVSSLLVVQEELTEEVETREELIQIQNARFAELTGNIIHSESDFDKVDQWVMTCVVRQGTTNLCKNEKATQYAESRFVVH